MKAGYNRSALSLIFDVINTFTSRKEIAEAQRTNKPCGKCYFYLLISKTYTNKKNAKKRGSGTHQKVELMFSNAEEEFFYEVKLLFSSISQVHFDSHIYLLQ